LYRGAEGELAAAVGWSDTRREFRADLGATLVDARTWRPALVQRPAAILARMIRFLTDEGQYGLVVEFRDPAVAASTAAAVLDELRATGVGWAGRPASQVAWQFRVHAPDPGA
jgi:hypothetical protein